MQVVVPIYIQLDELILPSTFTTIPESTQDVQELAPYYFLEVLPPINKKSISSIVQPSRIYLKDFNNLKAARMLLYPSIGLGRGSSYEVNLYKSTCYSGILKNRYHPARSTKPSEKLELLNTWYWLVPNIYRLQDYSYRAFEQFKKYSGSIPKETLVLQPNGNTVFDLSDHPEIIAINTITDSLGTLITFKQPTEANTTNSEFSISLELTTAPINPITIEYYTPLTIEEIVYIEHPRSYDSIAY